MELYVLLFTALSFTLLMMSYLLYRSKQAFKKLKENELDREKILTQLIKQNIAFEHFGYEVSHTLRAPVANIIGLIQILDLSGIDSAEQREIIGYIQQSISALDRKVCNLNAILSTRDEIIQELEEINLTELLRDVKDCLYGSLKRKDIRVSGNFRDADWVYSNRNVLYSVFYNLIISGITNRRENATSEIYIEAAIKSGYLELLFIDNGQLMRSDTNFGRFGLYQNSESGLINPNIELFMVKNQIEALNGTFHVNSDIHNNEFCMFLPLVENSNLYKCT